MATDAEARELTATNTVLNEKAFDIKYNGALSLDQLRKLIDELNRMDSFMPLFDPTAYMKERDHILKQLRIARAFYQLRGALEDA